MEKLPIRPLFFVPAYLLLWAISIYPRVVGLEFAFFWAALCGLGGFALHFTWTFRALAFVSKRPDSTQQSEDVSGRLRTARRFLLFMSLCLGGLILYKLYLQPAVLGGTPFDKLFEVLLVGVTLFLFFGIFWISARAVCEAEVGGKVPADRIAGTFLLFIYIVIGAPFIYRRLSNLSKQSLGSIAEPA